MKKRKGFTLIELMVTVVVVTTLLGLLLPALGAVRRSARTMQCLSNMRNMEVAHVMYVADNDGAFINIGLGAGHNESDSWVNTLEDYYGSTLLHRSPVDDSPYWPGGANATEVLFRRTSYGVNNFLVRNSGAGVPRPVTFLERVPNPSATIHFVYMSESDSSYAVMDHPHVEQWGVSGVESMVLDTASKHLETHAHGGPEKSWDSVSNYGFLDGHASTLSFKGVYRNNTDNQFNPAVAR